MRGLGELLTGRRETARPKEAERRRLLLAQAEALTQLAAQGYTAAQACEMLDASAPDVPAAINQVQRLAVPGLAKAWAEIERRAPEIAGPTLKVYPGLAAAALTNEHTQGLALWLLARSLDEKGAGRILRAELQEQAIKIISKDKFKRALKDAQAACLLHLVQRRRDGAEVAIITGALMAAQALGAETLGAVPVLVPAGKMRNAALWKATLWGVYQTGRTRTPAPISRATLEQLSGVAERSQRRYEKKTNVEVMRNYWLDELPKDKEQLKDRIAEHALAGRSAIVIRGRRGSSLLVTMPNTYTAPRARLARRGSVRKINRSLRGGLTKNAVGQHALSRLFFDDRDAASKAAKRYDRKLDNAPARVFSVARPAESGALLWRSQLVSLCPKRS